jgi:hypothetical protein
MTKPDHAELLTGATLMLPNLSQSICQEIAQLANPSGLGHLNAVRLQDIRSSLDTTCKQLKARIAQSTLTESQDLMLMHEALKTAAEVIELLHQPA